MSRYQDAFDAHQRARFMRPDAHRWIRRDAARFLMPGTDPASVYPALAPAETKYNPNQPRVPAGNGRESGRWTDGGGGIGSLARPMGQINFGDLPNFSDLFGLFQITPTEADSTGLQLSQNNERQGYPVDLLEERELGGHTIERHVGRSNESLLNDVRQAQRYSRETGFSEELRVGSFSSLQSANRLVNSTLSQNADKVDSVASGLSSRERIDGQYSSVTGLEAYARNERSQVNLRATYGVRVIIVRDERSNKGYRVDTAFPVTPGN